MASSNSLSPAAAAATAAAAAAAAAGAAAAAAGAAAPADGSSAVYGALVNQFLNPKGANLTATVDEFLDMCDYGFLMHLDREIAGAGPESTQVGKVLGYHMITLKRHYEASRISWYKMKLLTVAWYLNCAMTYNKYLSPNFHSCALFVFFVR